MQDIPDFLLTNLSTSQIDRTHFLNDLQLWAIWRHVQGTKQFDMKKASRLRKELIAKRNTERKKAEENVRKIKEKEQAHLRMFCQYVAERVLNVELTFDDGEISTKYGIIEWNTKIKDNHSSDVFGTPHELLMADGFDFVNCGDPRKSLKTFIDNLRQYDEYVQSYTFERSEQFDPYNPTNTIQEAPFVTNPSRFVHFNLTLKWSPFSDSELLKKAKKWVKKVSPNE